MGRVDVGGAGRNRPAVFRPVGPVCCRAESTAVGVRAGRRRAGSSVQACSAKLHVVSAAAEVADVGRPVPRVRREGHEPVQRPRLPSGELRGERHAVGVGKSKAVHVGSLCATCGRAALSRAPAHGAPHRRGGARPRRGGVQPALERVPLGGHRTRSRRARARCADPSGRPPAAAHRRRRPCRVGCLVPSLLVGRCRVQVVLPLHDGVPCRQAKIRRPLLLAAPGQHGRVRPVRAGFLRRVASRC